MNDPIYRYLRGYSLDPGFSTRLDTVGINEVVYPVRFEPLQPAANHPKTCTSEPYMTDVVLSDGGVYDNLGLEIVWKNYQTVLASDGGGKMQPEPEPKSDWARHALRINGLIDNQVRSLRKRLLMASFEGKQRAGTYWGVRSDMAKYIGPGSLPCPEAKTLVLANTPTRLKRMEPVRASRQRLPAFATIG